MRDAPDGAAGVARAPRREPDVVLLDLMMPGELDGMATLAQLRERLPDVPVVMMSGRAGLSDAVQATKLGAFNFLEKPLSPEGVLLALRVGARAAAGAARSAERCARISGSTRRDDRRQPGDGAGARDDRARRADAMRAC